MAKKNPTKISGKSGRQDIVITREFDAPRELVFEAHVNPDIYGQWIGPRKFKTTFDRFDTKNGGSWRYTFKDMDGHELSFHGVYHEVKAPEKIVGTFEFEGDQGYVVLNSTIFEQLAENRTKLTVQSVFQTVEERDGELRFLTEDGVEDIFSRLDDLLRKGESF
jgi:uncharacterized protein YndB with AHSA1/START domain